MKPCLKQLTRCVVVTSTDKYEATNECDVDSLTICPRVTAGCPTGEGYELCGSTHAEANAAEAIPEDNSGGTAFLFGHTWFCGPCQHSLTAKGVTTFVVTGEPA